MIPSMPSVSYTPFLREEGGGDMSSQQKKGRQRKRANPCTGDCVFQESILLPISGLFPLCFSVFCEIGIKSPPLGHGVDAATVSPPPRTSCVKKHKVFPRPQHLPVSAPSLIPIPTPEKHPHSLPTSTPSPCCPPARLPASVPPKWSLTSRPLLPSLSMASMLPDPLPAMLRPLPGHPFHSLR